MQSVETRNRRPGDLLLLGIGIASVGAVSLIASIIASGLQYRALETAGKDVGLTPTWVMAWHAVSWLLLAVGVPMAYGRASKMIGLNLVWRTVGWVIVALFVAVGTYLFVGGLVYGL